MKTYEEIREQERLKRAQRDRRKEYAPERNALPMSKLSQIPDAPLPADGIQKWPPDANGHVRELCVTPEAMEARRWELWCRCGGQCEGCNFTLTYSGVAGFHLHHIHGRGRGQCDCMKCIQALCKDAPMLDGSMRPGCHTMQHNAIDTEGKFDPDRSCRLGQPFVRPEAEA
jgi:hypothetical protein